MRKVPLFMVFILIGVVSVRFIACKHEPMYPNITPPPTPPPSTHCSPDTVYFQNEVLPLFQTYCAKSGCHDGTSEGAALDNYTNIFVNGHVIPGNPDGSWVYRSITIAGEEGLMPPSDQPQLTQSQILAIGTWITQGAFDNRCDSAGCDTVNVKYSNIIAPIIQTYCLGCHSGPNPSYSINLSTYDGVVGVAKSNRLMGALRQETGFFAMPKNAGKLSDCQIAQFQKWIDTDEPF